MRRVGIQPGVPEKRDRERCQGNGQVEGVEAFVEHARVPFVDAGNEVRRPDQGERGGKSADHRVDVPRESQARQSRINGALVTVAPRHMDMPRSGKAGRRHFAIAERVPCTPGAARWA